MPKKPPFNVKVEHKGKWTPEELAEWTRRYVAIVMQEIDNPPPGLQERAE